MVWDELKKTIDELLQQVKNFKLEDYETEEYKRYKSMGLFDLIQVIEMKETERVETFAYESDEEKEPLTQEQELAVEVEKKEEAIPVTEEKTAPVKEESLPEEQEKIVESKKKEEAVPVEAPVKEEPKVEEEEEVAVEPETKEVAAPVVEEKTVPAEKKEVIEIQGYEQMTMETIKERKDYKVIENINELKRQWYEAELGELSDEDFEGYLGRTVKSIDIESDDDTINCRFDNHDTQYFPVSCLFQKAEENEDVSKKSVAVPVVEMSGYEAMTMESIKERKEYKVIENIEELKKQWYEAELGELSDEDFEGYLGRTVKSLDVESDDDTVNCRFDNHDTQYFPVNCLYEKREEPKVEEQEEPKVEEQEEPKVEEQEEPKVEEQEEEQKVVKEETKPVAKTVEKFNEQAAKVISEKEPEKEGEGIWNKLDENTKNDVLKDLKDMSDEKDINNYLEQKGISVKDAASVFSHVKPMLKTLPKITKPREIIKGTSTAKVVPIMPEIQVSHRVKKFEEDNQKMRSEMEEQTSPRTEDGPPSPRTVPSSINSSEKVNQSRGLLMVSNMAGKYLQGSDYFSKGDPYLKITTPQGTNKTKTKSGQNPKFRKEEFALQIRSSSDIVTFEFYDWDRFSKHDLIGTVSRPATFFNETRSAKSWTLDLDTQGKLKVKTKWIPQHDDAEN